MKYHPSVGSGMGLIILLVFSVVPSLFAQSPHAIYDITSLLDNGVRFRSNDGNTRLRVGFRLQMQLKSTITLEQHTEQEFPHLDATFRRARIWFKGSFWDGKVSYFTNFLYDRMKPGIADAVIEWHPHRNHTLGIGQFRAYEDRQMRTSSGALQFVERSRMCSVFTKGYDRGIYWNSSWVPPDNPGINLYLSATHGEGMNKWAAPGGYFYTGRVELLPFGRFAANGDYTAGMLDNQPEPKLSIGIALTIDRDVHDVFGPGVEDGEGSDVASMFTDFIYKYRHYSIMGQVVWREARNTNFILAPSENLNSRIQSRGWLLQCGSLVAPSLELALRFEQLHPGHSDKLQWYPAHPQDRLGLAGTWYIHRQNIKLQADVMMVDEADQIAEKHERHLETRMQFQLNF